MTEILCTYVCRDFFTFYQPQTLEQEVYLLFSNCETTVKLQNIATVVALVVEVVLNGYF